MPYAHPTVEHFAPLFVTLGAAAKPDDAPKTAIEGYFLGLSKRSFEAGARVNPGSGRRSPGADVAAPVRASQPRTGLPVTDLCRRPRPRSISRRRGRKLTQARARELAQGPGVILLCGRFEGVDERVLEARDVEEISIGDYVLSGGELAALVLIDACVRLLPGVAGNEVLLSEESFTSGLLEYPHYTRPRDFEGRSIRRTCCSPATMRESPNGGASRPRRSPRNAAPISRDASASTLMVRSTRRVHLEP